MSDLLIDEWMLGMVVFYDFDFEVVQKNEVIGNYSGDGRWRYEVVFILKKVLLGVDIVIIFILLGLLEDMEIDVYFFECCGIYQFVGDIVGLGGIIRSLWVVLMFVDIVWVIRDYVFELWVINYINLMFVCIRVLYKVFLGIKVIGCCYEVFGM